MKRPGRLLQRLFPSSTLHTLTYRYDAPTNALNKRVCRDLASTRDDDVVTMRAITLFRFISTITIGACSTTFVGKKKRGHPVIHYHLHKTGGMTFNEIILERYHMTQLHGSLRPPLSEAFAKYPTSFFVAFVRDPVKALLSRFYYWRALGKR